MLSHATEGIIFSIQKYSIHDGPGIRTTVFMKGCTLRCAWCSNPESQKTQQQTMGDGLDSKRYTVEEILAICMQDQAYYQESGGGVTISGGEPLVQWQFAMALLQKLKQNKIHTAIETSGYVSRDIFTKAITDADLLLFDIKHYDSAKHKRGTGASNGMILDNLSYCIESGKEVLVRIPIIPGFNDAIEDAKQFSNLLNARGISTAQLLPFHQLGEKKYEPLGIPYAMKGVKPLHADELTPQKEVFMQNGITVIF